MKKTIVILLAALAAGTASAQWSWGLKLGTNVATLAGNGFESPVDGTKKVMKTGFLGGFVVEYPFADFFGLQGELYYSRQGASLRNGQYDVISGEEVEKSRDRMKFEYVNLPLMLKFYPMPGLSVEAGPQIGYMLSAANEYKSTTDAGEGSFARKFVSTEKAVLSPSSFERFDYGVAAGASYELWRGVSFTARYYYGLQNLSKTKLLSGSDPELHNSVLQLGITTRF